MWARDTSSASSLRSSTLLRALAALTSFVEVPQHASSKPSELLQADAGRANRSLRLNDTPLSLRPLTAHATPPRWTSGHAQMSIRCLLTARRSSRPTACAARPATLLTRSSSASFWDGRQNVRQEAQRSANWRASYKTPFARAGDPIAWVAPDDGPGYRRRIRRCVLSIRAASPVRTNSVGYPQELATSVEQQLHEVSLAHDEDSFPTLTRPL